MTTLVTKDTALCAEIIGRGGLVAVPTETVYGLAGSALSHDAVARIYEVKGRPEIKPLSIMVPGEEAMDVCCVEVPAAARLFARRFWPGPLTIVLKSRPVIPEIVRAGGDTVGLRCPDHPLTLSLLRACGEPLAAPSANLSGMPSPKTVQEVLSALDGSIDAVLDGGPCGIGRESTIVSLATRPYSILRQGALPEDDVWDALVDDMQVIGITGGTGSGKSTALAVLGEMGALCLDCDEIYHRLTESSHELRQELCDCFGDVYTDGALDRKRLGSRVFGDPAALEELSAITHKYVSAEIQRLLHLHARNGGRLAAIDAIALIESGLSKRCSAVYYVSAPREIRIRRIMYREGISREYAELRVDAQKPDEYFRSRCTETLDNSGTKSEFAAVCRAAFEKEIING